MADVFYVRLASPFQRFHSCTQLFVWGKSSVGIDFKQILSSLFLSCYPVYEYRILFYSPTWSLRVPSHFWDAPLPYLNVLRRALASLAWVLSLMSTSASFSGWL